MPSPSNPQSWNRYSYVSNNPLKYTDPTGHMQVNDGDSQRGSNCHGDFAKYCNKGKPKSREELKKMRESAEENNSSSRTITLGLSLGSTGELPDYNGDYPDNTNVPYFPGGNTQPNPCAGGKAAWGACFVAFLNGVFPPAAAPTNATNDFYLTFSVTYDGRGIDMSDVQWSNRYRGQAVFSDLQVNNRSFRVDPGSYMPHDGVYRPIPGSGAYITDGNLSLTASLYVMKGSYPFPYKLTYP